ncbi:MAG: hypothetical protein RLY66_84 [Candidatus Parcubacteria bacterium]
MNKKKYWNIFSTTLFCVSLVSTIFFFIVINIEGSFGGPNYAEIFAFVLSLFGLVSSVQIRKERIWAKYAGVILIILFLVSIIVSTLK